MKKDNTEKKTVRCAIYTRKSVSEGLEKEFNSLDAQRESALNYIAAQKHEGWIALEKQYDDGGFTGGNMERPALQELFRDIKSGKVDMVVVYKVDRLSRSLMDFAKIIELLDKHKVSFVSVTQHFNTKDSMGRLTLNILLSFAQFEREIISERTHDKMSAARRRGKWIGGIPILGYDIVPEGGAIVINQSEAQTVRKIFSYYIECRSIQKTLEYLNDNDIRGKQWKTRKGMIKGGNGFSLTTLNHLLKNMAYIGKINYDGHIYDAEFESLLSEEVFNRAQEIIKQNTIDKSPRVRNKYNALLAGKVYCGHCGTSMVHSYTKKTKTKVYRYYTCSNATKRGWKYCPHPSLCASELEKQVVLELERISDDVKLRKEIIESFYEKSRTELAEAIRNESSIKRSLSDIRKQIAEADASSVKMLDLRKNESETARTLLEIQSDIGNINAKISVEESRLIEIFSNFKILWSGLTFKEQYDIVDCLIEKVVYDGVNGTIQITFRDSGIKGFERIAQ